MQQVAIYEARVYIEDSNGFDFTKDGDLRASSFFIWEGSI